MRTSLVVIDRDYFRRDKATYRRATKPGDDAPKTVALGVWYSPAHKAHGHNSKGQKEWQQPESVNCRNGYYPKCGRVDEIRHITDTVTAALLDEIDHERAQITQRLAELQKEEQEALAEAFTRGRAVTVEEAKVWTEQQKQKQAVLP